MPTLDTRAGMGRRLRRAEEQVAVMEAQGGRLQAVRPACVLRRPASPPAARWPPALRGISAQSALHTAALPTAPPHRPPARPRRPQEVASLRRQNGMLRASEEVLTEDTSLVRPGEPRAMHAAPQHKPQALDCRCTNLHPNAS